MDLIDYFNHIALPDKQVEIEIINPNKIDILSITAKPDPGKFEIEKYANPFKSYFQGWHLKTGVPATDSIMRSLGWNRNILIELTRKLHKAKCISIRNGDPAWVGFHRYQMVKYYYNKFNTPLPEYYIKNYNDSSRYIYVNQYLALEFRGGATGPQCFYNTE